MVKQSAKKSGRTGLERISVISTLRHSDVAPALAKRLVKFVTGREGRQIDQIEILIVGARRMASLNRRLLNHRGPTDVISLDLAQDLRAASVRK